MNGSSNLDELEPHLAKQSPVKLKVVGVDPKSYFDFDMLLYTNFRMLSTSEYNMGLYG
jgi:hypothetical protein